MPNQLTFLLTGCRQILCITPIAIEFSVAAVQLDTGASTVLSALIVRKKTTV